MSDPNKDKWKYEGSMISGCMEHSEQARPNALLPTEEVGARLLVEQWHREWIEARGPHWGDAIVWKSAREIAERIEAMRALAKPDEGPPK